MPALTKGRNTPARSGDRREPPVAAATRIWIGAMVAINAAGWAVAATAAVGLKIIGRAEDTVDNLTGAAGDLRVPVGAGVYRYANSAAADLITRADINANCFAVDDNTVAKTDGTGTRSVAGKVFDVDAEGVWVAFY